MDKYSLPKKVLNETTGNPFAFVYQIRCKITDEIYVGKTINPRKRCGDHINAAMNGSDALPHLFRALRKHGIEQFEFQIVSKHDTEDDAFNEEIRMISELKRQKKSLLNTSGGGRGGSHTSPETRAKMSASQKRRWNDQSRQYHSDKMKQVWSSPNLRQDHSEIQKAWSTTSQARLKNSCAQSRPEVREAKSSAMKKRWQNDEDLRHRHKESVTSDKFVKLHSHRQTEAWRDPVQRQKMIDGMNKPEVRRTRQKRLKHEGNPRAKLTWDRVRQIRRLHSNGLSTVELMKIFSEVSYCTLRRIVTNKTWVEHDD